LLIIGLIYMPAVQRARGEHTSLSCSIPGLFLGSRALPLCGPWSSLGEAGVQGCMRMHARATHISSSSSSSSSPLFRGSAVHCFFLT
jgi:hypothetical protein